MRRAELLHFDARRDKKLIAMYKKMGWKIRNKTVHVETLVNPNYA